MENATTVENVNAEIAQTERIGLGDLVIAGVLAAVTWLFLSCWDFPAMLPSIWNDAAEASGIRPASSVLPGYWRILATFVYRVTGIHGGEVMLALFGRMSLALIAVLVYAALREMLAFIMRARPQLSRRRTAVMRIAAVVGAVAFVCSDPVWSAGQYFSETTLLILLTLLSIEFFFVFLRKGSLKYAYLCSALVGLLAAETPFGLVLAGVFVFVNQFVLKVMPALESPFYNPALIAVGKWYMTFLFLAALVGGVLLNSVSFVFHHGLSAVDATVGTIPLSYLLAYWGRIAGCADPLGWILWTGVCVTPFLVSIVRFPAAADEEVFLPYFTGFVFLVCGTVAVSQAASLPSLWFWSYCSVPSDYFLSVGNLLLALTLAAAVTILGVDALCRNHKRLAEQMFAVGDDEGDIQAYRRKEIKVNSGLTTRILRLAGMVIVPAAIVLTMIPGRAKTDTREMLAVIRDAVAETVTEAGDREYLFTDGNLDAAIELEARRRGKPIKCMNMLGGNSAMAAYLRTRGLKGDKEDFFSFHHDCGMGLRTWLRDRPVRLKRAAVQMGFDLWKRDGHDIPPMGGLLSLPTGWEDDGVRRASVARAMELAGRALAITRRGGEKNCTDESVERAFYSVMWRLSRFCTYRGERADLAGDVQDAIAEVTMAKKLNEANAIYRRLVELNDKYNSMLLQRLTPREGLQLALVRADFTMAKVYAETILAGEPENADANFAMGMFYQKARQLARAEEYLRRCLINKPDEPAIYNNLAMLQMELGKFDAAEANVDRALELLPNSAAVKDTKKLIVKARAERNTKAAAAGR